MYENSIDIKEYTQDISEDDLEKFKEIFTPFDYELNLSDKFAYKKIDEYYDDIYETDGKLFKEPSKILSNNKSENKIELPMEETYEGYYKIYTNDNWIGFNIENFERSIEIYSIQKIHSDNNSLFFWAAPGCGKIELEIDINEIYLEDGMNKAQIMIEAGEAYYKYNVFFEYEKKGRVVPLLKLNSIWNSFDTVNFYSNDYIEVVKNKEYIKSKILIESPEAEFNGYEVYSRNGHVNKYSKVNELTGFVDVGFTDNFIKNEDYNAEFEDIIILKIYNIEYGFKIKLKKIGLVCEQKFFPEASNYKLLPAEYNGDKISVFFDYAYPDYDYPKDFYLDVSFMEQPAVKKIGIEITNPEKNSEIKFDWRGPNNLCLKLKTANAPKISELKNLNSLEKNVTVELKEIYTGQKRLFTFKYAMRYSPSKIFEHNIFIVKEKFPLAFKIWMLINKLDIEDKIIFFDELAQLVITIKNKVDFPILIRPFSFHAIIKDDTIIKNDTIVNNVISKSLLEGSLKKKAIFENEQKPSHYMELMPKKTCEWQFEFNYNYYDFYEVSVLDKKSDITIKINDGYRSIDITKPCCFINLKQIKFFVQIYGLVLLLVFLAISFIIVRFMAVNI